MRNNSSKRIIANAFQPPLERINAATKCMDAIPLGSDAENPDIGLPDRSPSRRVRLESLSPKRLQLLNWFRSDAAPLADAYEGALHLIDDDSFPGRVHFIAHAVRDISDRLVFVLDPQLEASRVQYENEMDRIEKMWPAPHEFNVTDLEAPAQNEMAIDYKVAVVINSLIEAHRERRRRPSNYELLFRFLMRNEPTRADVNVRLVSDFKKMQAWFMSIAHLRSRNGAEVLESKLQAEFSKFEGMLHSFVGDFFTSKAELDEILQHANN